MTKSAAVEGFEVCLIVIGLAALPVRGVLH